MTRIMIIASGLAQSGKTHLAINLALELVRRGRLVAVFEDADSPSSIEDYLVLQLPRTHTRRADDNNVEALSRQGYQGIDVIACSPLLRPGSPDEREQQIRCIQAMDIPEGYEDFLIDTSGFGPRPLLACCLASTVVVLVVTPDPHSQAEAFALLKILQLNGFSGELRLVVNRVSFAIDAEDICKRLSGYVRASLGLDLKLLGPLPEDEHVPMAQHARQAFSSLFPELEITGSIVTLTDSLDDLTGRDVAGAQSLSAFWGGFLEKKELPVKVPGGMLLETPDSC